MGSSQLTMNVLFSKQERLQQYDFRKILSTLRGASLLAVFKSLEKDLKHIFHYIYSSSKFYCILIEILQYC